MPVTKVTRTAAATWTASGLAQIVEDSFIDGGILPSGWHSRFLSTAVENRVLKVVNSAETKGTAYYWFQFTTSTVVIRPALAWDVNATTPSGILYQDYLTTTTNSTTALGYNTLIAGLSTATSATMTSYRSGINPDVSFYVLRNGTNYSTFSIPYGSNNALSFVDQSKVNFNGAYTVSGFNNGTNQVNIASYTAVPLTRSTYLGAVAARGSISTTLYDDNKFTLASFTAPGNVSASTSNLSYKLSTILPIAITNTASGITADHTPVFTSPTLSPYMPALPADFGIAPYYASNAMTIQDTLVVSSGVQEWEMLYTQNNSTADTGKILFVARTV